jgi:hypothetical protein
MEGMASSTRSYVVNRLSQDGVALFRDPAVDNLRFGIAAKWTPHVCSLKARIAKNKHIVTMRRSGSANTG